MPFLARNPVFGYLADSFTRPYPFTPDVAVAIDETMPTVIDALHCHTSQVYEWLPFNSGFQDQVPADQAGRKALLENWYLEHFADNAEKYRELLVAEYGVERAQRARAVEAFEISEYGSPLTEALRRELFPFLYS